MAQKDNHPLLSLIIPVYNRESTLGDLFRSLARQAYRPVEIILVDNASTDTSARQCLDFQKTYQADAFNILVAQEPTQGANYARNKGLSLSTGDYVYFFDSDDTLNERALERMALNLTIHHYPELLVFPFTINRRDGSRVTRPHHFSRDPAEQLLNGVVSTHNACIKRSLIEKSGHWNARLDRWQDLEFGFRLLLHADTVVWVKGRPFYEVKEHQASISGVAFSEDAQTLTRTLDAIHSLICQQPDGRQKDRMLRCLSFMLCTLATLINRESTSAAAKDLYNQAVKTLPDSRARFTRFILRFHYWYSGLGGRGFWRIARHLL